MKLFRLGGYLSLCAIALAGCESTEGEAGAEGEQPAAAPAGEQPAAGAEGAAPAAAPAAPEVVPPAAQCGKLLEGIKAKSAEQVHAVSMDVDMLTPETIEMLAGELGEATCGEEKVDGDKATVAVTAGAETRDIPFTRVENAWKFDAKAYAEKYPPGKGKKGKKGKKEKAKKGKKGKK
jgi:hypothetical protein